jgi:hypothetical protein
MSVQPITTRLFKGGKKVGEKKINPGGSPVVAPDGNRPIKTYGGSKLFNGAPKSPLNK